MGFLDKLVNRNNDSPTMSFLSEAPDNEKASDADIPAPTSSRLDETGLASAGTAREVETASAAVSDVEAAANVADGDAQRALTDQGLSQTSKDQPDGLCPLTGDEAEESAGGGASDDLMDIFTSEEEEDSRLLVLTSSLEELDIHSLLTDALEISVSLREFTTDRQGGS